MVYLRFRGTPRTIGRRTLAISKTLHNMLVTMNVLEILSRVEANGLTTALCCLFSGGSLLAYIYRESEGIE